MVAYTPNLCLPYLEGSDSLCLNTGTVCDPSNAWCDLVALVEAQLQAIEDIDARTGRGVPLAQISYTPETPVALPNNVIPFDTVNVDTDSMVDLDAFTGIIPRRNGIYELHLLIEYNILVPLASDRHFWAQILVGNEAIPTAQANEVGVSYATSSLSAGASSWFSRSTHTLWEFESGTPVPRTVFARSDSSVVPVTHAALTVLWHSEVVA